MKRMKKTAVMAMTACMLLSAVPVAAMQSMDSGITAYAGANDFSWSTYKKKDASWWTSSEAIAYGDEILAYQLSDGGWRKDMKTETTGSWNKSTIDNDATWGQIRYLARLYTATGTEKYKTSCLKAIDLLLNGQYSNGGWPQVFNDPGTYHAHITFNDSAMIEVMKIMQDAATKSGDFAFIDSTRQSRAQTAVDKGVECILKCQITINGTLTAWGQQHDENTLAPAGARAYELPSVCTSESAGIVNFLRILPDEKKTPAVIRSINAAVRWFDAVKIENTKFDWNSDKTDKLVTYSSGSTIWARFYDLQNSKPMFSDRDGKVYTDVSQISQERRTGYSWYGTWCAENIKLGTLPEPSEPSQPEQTQGTHLYVGYSNKSSNYNTVQEAVNAAAALAPASEEQRVNIHIAPGTYREQVIVDTPFISFINDDPTKEVKLTWYYGIGYKYYSMGSDGYYNAANAASKSAKGEAARWGSAVALKKNADYFRAEHITFENSFNRYVTDEELADGVEVSGSQKITFQRTKGADVTTKTATERAAAIAVEGDYSEFFECTFLGSQDTLYVGSAAGYFRQCHIVGNTDYIFGQGNMIFQDCNLEFAGYSDKAVGGYITAMKDSGKTLFYNCNVTAASGKQVGSGFFGRPWGASANVAFVNTKLQYENIISSAGWTAMSNNDPANAMFKEYNTTAGGKAVNTSGRVSGTVQSSGNGLDVTTYLNGWSPYYLNGSAPEVPEYDAIDGNFVKQLKGIELPDSWAIDSDIQIGDKIYTDRDMVYVTLPQEVIGAESINIPCNAKTASGNIAAFTAGEDINVYVAFDTRVENIPAWMSGWNDTGLLASNDQYVDYKLFCKEFSAGDVITLGANGQSAYCVNYTVFVTSAQPAEVKGDVNGDGQLAVSDLVELQKWLLACPDAKLDNWSAADLYNDDRIDVYDFVELRELLIQ